MLSFSPAAASGRICRESGRVRAVAEGLVVRCAAATQRHPIPNLIGFAISGNYRDAAFDPDRAADFLVRVLDQTERRFEFRFDGFAGLLIPHHQPTGRTMRRLKFRQSPGFGIIALFDQVPNPPFRVAETGKGTKALRVSKVQGRTFDGLGLLQIRLTAGGFSSVELGLLVAAIAERFVAGLTASAQGILRRRRMLLPLPVIE